MNPRKTQRVPQSCTECAVRRIRCSKEIPCSACIKRGEAQLCHRELVDVRGRIHNDTSVRKVEDLEAEIEALKARLTLQNKKTFTFETEHDPGVSDSEPLHLLNRSMDYMSHGLASFPGQRLSDPPAPPAAQIRATLLSLLPNKVTLDLLLEWAHTWVWWHHCAYHIDTFKQEIEKAFDTSQAEPDWGVSALILAVAAVALYYMDESEAVKMGFTSAEAQGLPSVWFQASLQSLHQSDYLSNHRLVSVQTIVVLGGIAQALGKSALHTTLIAIGVRIAHSLCIHRLGKEPCCPIQSEYCIAHQTTGQHIVTTVDVIERETSRRLWVSLFVTERCSLGFRERQLWVESGDSVPLNMEDTVIDGIGHILPPDQASGVAHHLAALDIAAMLQDLQKAVLNVDSNGRRELDLRIDALLDRPVYRHVSVQPVWMPWARHTWRVNILHKRIILHRLYFARSFKLAEFEPERQICVETARRILELRSSVHPAMFEKIQANMSHPLTAAIILAIDFYHSPVSGALAEQKRREIRLLAPVLSRGIETNPYAQSASKLYQSLLDAEDSFRATQTFAPEHGWTEQPALLSSPMLFDGTLDWSWLDMDGVDVLANVT